MKSTRKDSFLIIENEGEALTEFISELTRREKEISENNLIIDLSNYKDLTADNILGFMEFSSLHRNRNKSFVIVNDVVGIDDLPEELVVVPTMQEAEDMIQMDEIQRDLGF